MINYFRSGNVITAILQEKDKEGKPIVMSLNLKQYGDGLLEDLNTLTEQEFIDKVLSNSHNMDEIRNVNSLVKRFNDLNTTDITQRDGLYYHKDIPNLSIPKELLECMVEALETKDKLMFNSLVLFWKRCAANENAQSRTDLFEFLKNGKYIITPKGHFLAYRHVVDVETKVGNTYYKQLFGFVQEQIKSAPKKWKKKPSKLFVVNTSPTDSKFLYQITTKKKGSIGRLDKVWEKCQKNTTFTDARTGTFSIKMKKIVSQDRKDCDYDNLASCSNGLHVGTADFVSNNNFGNVGIRVLVNPTDVVAVPKHDSQKLRTSKYFPIDFIDYDKDGNVKEPNSKLFENMFIGQSMEELHKKLSKMSFMELVENRILPQDIEVSVFNNTVRDLDNINSKLKGRVINL